MPSPRLQLLLARVMPFLVLGLIIVLFIIGIFVFSYVLIFACLVGFILFVVAWVRDKVTGRRKMNSNQPPQKTPGRIIDQNNSDGET